MLAEFLRTNSKNKPSLTIPAVNIADMLSLKKKPVLGDHSRLIHPNRTTGRTATLFGEQLGLVGFPARRG